MSSSAAGHPREPDLLDALWRQRYSEDGATAFCPKCQCGRRFHRARTRRSYCCDDCGHHIHPTAGTILHRTRLPLEVWAKAGSMAHEPDTTPSAIARACDVSRATAVRMLTALQSSPDFELPVPPQQLDRPRDDRVVRVLRAACHTLAHRGFASARLADIAQEAGISPAAIHYYFASKDALLLETLRWCMEQAYERIDVAGERAGPARRLGRLIELGLPYPGPSREERLLLTELWSRMRQRPELLGEYKRFSEQWRDVIREVIISGCNAGVFVPVAEPVVVADRLRNMIDGVAQRLALEYDADELGQCHDLLLGFAAEQLTIDPSWLSPESRTE